MKVYDQKLLKNHGSTRVQFGKQNSILKRVSARPRRLNFHGSIQESDVPIPPNFSVKNLPFSYMS